MTSIKYSKSVAKKVIAERNIEATKPELAQAAEAHDRNSNDYLSRDELELGASDLQAATGTLPPDRIAMDETKIALAEAGIAVTDAQLSKVLEATDFDHEKAQRGMLEQGRLELLEKVIENDALPSAPDDISPAVDSTDALKRRKINASFQRSGAGEVKVAFFDADSTLRVARSGNVSANSGDDVAALPFTADKIVELVEDGYLIAIVSNQAGVQHGHVSIEDADAALQNMAAQLRVLGAEVHYTDFAESSGPNRKPNTGMFDRLNELLVETYGDGIDKDASLMIGDSSYKPSDTRPDGTAGTRFSNSDRKFAENAGIDFHEPGEFFGWTDYGVSDFDKFDQRNAFLDQFDVGKIQAAGPLATRIASAADGT